MGSQTLLLDKYTKPLSELGGITPIILLPWRMVQSLVGLPLVSAQRSADLVSQGGFHHAVVAHVRCGTPRTLLLSSFAAAAAPPRSSFPPRSVTVGQPSRQRVDRLSSQLLSPRFYILLCVGVDLSH